jgi:hypothetical protein
MTDFLHLYKIKLFKTGVKIFARKRGCVIAEWEASWSLTLGKYYSGEETKKGKWRGFNVSRHNKPATVAKSD